MYCVAGSMTQMSASVTSTIWDRVRFMRPPKIDTCWVIRNALKEIAKTSPRYLARSPVSMRMATQFIALELRRVFFSAEVVCGDSTWGCSIGTDVLICNLCLSPATFEPGRNRHLFLFATRAKACDVFSQRIIFVIL